MTINTVSSRKLKQSIIEVLGQPPGVEDLMLEIPPLRDPARPADLH